MIEVKLTDPELILLDGKCSEPVQAEVDQAKRRAELASFGLPAEILEFVTTATATAKERGLLTWAPTSISYCRICKRSAGYATHTRNSRYHRKGDRNLDRPLTFSGVDLDRGFIVMRDHVSLGGCTECVEAALPLLRSELRDVAAELPEKLAGDRRFKRADKVRCKECGWAGHEGQMRKLRTMMRDSFYPGGCPKCPAENKSFNPTRIEKLKGFEVYEVTKP